MKYGEKAYHMKPEYLHGYAWANSVDPDQTPHSAASDQDLHCLPLMQQILDISTGGKMDLLNF